jgi:hypothetical protein
MHAEILLDFAHLTGSGWRPLETTRMTDAVEKGFSGGRADFLRGTGATLRK